MVKVLLAAVMFFIGVSGDAHAISETDFTAQYENEVAAFYATGRFGEFSGKDNLRIRYAAFEQDNATGVLIVLHGKSESYIKYAEVVYDLQDLGLSCYLMDARGFGFSERIIDDDPEKVYVDRFDDYVDDLKVFIDTVVMAKPYAQIFFLSHSLGGCIAARFLEKYPDAIAAAVLSSPMLEIDTGSFPPAVAYTVAALGTALGKGADYAIGQGPRDDGPCFFASTTTHSLARWSKWEEDIIPCNPEIRSGGATYGWLKRSFDAGLLARRQAGRLTTPVLMLQAEEDWFVKPEGQDRFCTRADDCSKVYMFGSRHEILMEVDEIRSIALDAIRSFLGKYRR